jgi:hypothetical protein
MTKAKVTAKSSHLVIVISVGRSRGPKGANNPRGLLPQQQGQLFPFLIHAHHKLKKGVDVPGVGFAHFQGRP